MLIAKSYLKSKPAQPESASRFFYRFSSWHRLAAIARMAMDLVQHRAVDSNRFLSITTERAGYRLSFDEFALTSAANVARTTYG
jgi:hypothetical protein